MSTPRRAMSIAAVLFATMLVASAQTPRRAPAVVTAPSVRPAVLVLRVSDTTGPDGPTHHLDVVQPRGWKKLPFLDADQPEYSDDGAPQLGPGCSLLRTYTPDDSQDTRYFVYNVDLTEPQMARRWREFQQAERAEQRLARAEARSNSEWEQRRQRLLAVHEQTTQEGVEMMKAGEYRQALITLTRASELNQGDPVCRIHLTQVRVALGHDAEAAKVLRRALELQPKLVPMLLSLEQYYPHDEDFTIQVDTLSERVTKRHDVTPDEYLLLGFMQFQRGWMDDAYAAFKLAARGKPKDTLIQSYLDLTKPALGTINSSQPAR